MLVVLNDRRSNLVSLADRVPAHRRLVRRGAVGAVTTLAVALTLAACSSSTPSTSSPSNTEATTSPPAGSTSGGTVPAIGNATNLKVEPTISMGTTAAPSSLETKDLVVGTGATATAADTVVVQYVGADYATGADFDSSWSRGMASSFPLNGVVPGFAQGIEGMKVGGRREIVIPPALGYGANGSPPAVGANETLVFVVDLKSIAPPTN